MNKENYTSQLLSKWLQEKGFKGDTNIYWASFILGSSNGKPFFELIDRIDCLEKGVKKYPAYDILNDLCVKYAKELFGGTKEQRDKNLHNVFDLMIGNWKEEAEKYIMDNSILS